MRHGNRILCLSVSLCSRGENKVFFVPHHRSNERHKAMKTLTFTKMHGLGNDHIIIDLFKEKLPNPMEVAPKICDRHLGVGADGLILVGPSEKYDFTMWVINNDGSEAEMCGNGIR